MIVSEFACCGKGSTLGLRSDSVDPQNKLLATVVLTATAALTGGIYRAWLETLFIKLGRGSLVSFRRCRQLLGVLTDWSPLFLLLLFLGRAGLTSLLLPRLC